MQARIACRSAEPGDLAALGEESVAVEPAFAARFGNRLRLRGGGPFSLSTGSEIVYLGGLERER
ncbi:MAG: hypothetical protein ACYCYO_07980 [Bacilli bacterium]